MQIKQYFTPAYVYNIVKRFYRLIISFILLLLCPLAEAQVYVDLTAQQVRIDSLLPVFSWQKSLGVNYADSVYHVSIDYPEFIDMSVEDIRRYHIITSEPLPTMPSVHQSIGVVRKQGVLDVSFVPLVYRHGKYQKLVSFKLNVSAIPRSPKAGTRSMTRGASDRYADHSVLRDGIWVKIRIPESGFYQLTEALVRKAGFTDISRVKIYGYGGALQPEKLTGDYLMATDDLQEMATCNVDGKRIFYGTGPVTWTSKDTLQRSRNPYSDYGYYFLTESDGAPLTVEATQLVSAHYPAPNDYHSLYEVDDYAWYHGGRNLYDKTLFTIGNPQTYTLKSTGSKGKLAVNLTCDGSFGATVEVNGTMVGSITYNITLDGYTKAAEQGGADGISLINTFTAMKIDIYRRRFVLGNRTGGLSGPAIKPVAVRMV